MTHFIKVSQSLVHVGVGRKKARIIRISPVGTSIQPLIESFEDAQHDHVGPTGGGPIGGLQQGYMQNGKLSVTVSANDLTVAIKTLAGADPSAADPVYVRIGDTVRTISAALSVTAPDATNWCNAGSAELATKEIDYFVYLGYNATDGVVIGFSRIPYAKQHSDFSVTSTNEKYCKISTITNAASTDYYEVVGRFAATLSAGAAYTWTVPTFTPANLINHPIYETRPLTWAPQPTNLTIGNGSFALAQYRLAGRYVYFVIDFAFGSTSAITGSVNLTLPLAIAYPAASAENLIAQAAFLDSGTARFGGQARVISATTFTLEVWNTAGTYAQAASLSSTIPHTWAVNDRILAAGHYLN